ncbi:MAG: mycothiol synthase [Corynebacterium sp.]|nr:mycothiol synthase [Corynebacterium sp.]
MHIRSETTVATASELLDAATAADGVAPFSEQFLIGLEDASRQHTHWVANDGDVVIGLAASDGATAELVVHPKYRRHGIGSALLAKLGGTPVWAHGNLAGAQALAAAQGMQLRRELFVMRAALPLDAPQLPVGFAVWDLQRARIAIPNIAQRWLAVNNAAFDWHPEQGGWDIQRLQQAQETTWFTPKDVLFLIDTTGAHPQVAGFHWVKIVPEEKPGVGEVYVVGLSPEYQGRGLGKALTLVGTQHMWARNLHEVELYVESDNTPAVATYRALGFEVSESHALYGKSE